MGGMKNAGKWKNFLLCCGAECVTLLVTFVIFWDSCTVRGNERGL